MPLLLALLLALPAFAQEPPPAEPPPPPPDDEPVQPQTPAPRAEEVGYFDSCFGVPRPGAGRFGVAIETPIPIGPSSGPGGHSTSGIPSVSSGSGDDKAWVVVAVVAAMALPVVVYAVDNPAPRLVLQRFACPTFSFDFVGGADTSRAVLGDGSYGFVSTRFMFGVGHIATDFQYDGAPRGISAFAAHMLVRPTPKEHIDGGLAIGYRRSVLGDRIQDGFEFGLPHRYAFWRDGLRTLGLEIRPMLLVGTTIEPSLEAAFLIPLAQVLQMKVGGRVYTFQGDVLWGLSAGLSLTL